jgi:hypothetical protein
MNQPDCLPCVDCGAGVDNPTRIVMLQATAREVQLGGPGGPRIVQDGYWEYKATRCDRDQTRLWRAEGLADEHPAVVHKLGAKQHAIEMIDAALIGLINVGRDHDEWQQFMRTDRDLLRLVRRLAPHAMRMRWSADLAPISRLGSDSFFPDRPPWAHVADEQHQALRDAFAPVLWDQLGLPRKIVPPEDGARGCLYCGVGHLDVSADAGEEVWGQPRKARPGTLGGRPSPDARKGYLCPSCTKAVEAVGVMGPTSLALAFMTHLRVTAPAPDFWLPGLQAWSVLPETTETNAEPWGHIPNQSDVRDMIRGAGPADLATPQLEGRIVAKVR